MQSWKGKRNEEGTKVLKQRREGNPKEKPQHLYLVLDDWSWGYSIHKINLSFGHTGRQLILERGGAICIGMHRLPSALFRLHGRRGEPRSILGAFGNMILAMPPLDYKHGGTVIDIHARTFINGPWQDACQDVPNPICIPIGDRLFFLGDSFRMLYQSFRMDFYNFVWAWSELPKPIFQYELITSYAVHPNERTIFVSGLFGSPATFSIDTVDPSTFSFEEPMVHEWKQHGQWQLPFTGRGYFDPELDAWVGLSAQLDTVGHICMCDVVSTNYETRQQQCPALKFSKEKLFSEIPTERHMGATLIYLGDESKFCLLEGICIQADSTNQLTGSGEVNEDFVHELNESGSDEMNERSVAEFDENDSDETNELFVGEVNEDFVHELNESGSDEMNERSVAEFDENDSDETNELFVGEVNEEQNQRRFLRLTTFSLKYDKHGDLTTGNSRCVWYYSLPPEVTDPILEYPVAFWM